MLFRSIALLAMAHTASTLALPVLSEIIELIARQVGSGALPAGVTCPGTLQKQWLPALRTIGDNGTDPTIFHVANDTATGTSISQVMTFTDIPSTATNINVLWAQSAPPRVFTATGGGTVNVYYLDNSKLPTGDAILEQSVVDAAIDPSIATEGRIGSGAFGGWPLVETQQNHLVGGVYPLSSVPSTMSFRLQLQENGDVRLVQEDGKNGWFLMYNC